MLIHGLNYQQASDYFIVPAGSYTFDVTAAQPDAKLSLAETLKANTVTSVFAVGVVMDVPKLQLKAVQVVGIPSLPLTGSDPNAGAPPATSQPPLLWLLSGLLLLAIAAGIAMLRVVMVHNGTKVRTFR